MAEGDVAKPLAVFVLLLVAALVVVAALAFVGGPGGGAADGERIRGQSPPQFQPDAVLAETDPETGDIDVSRGDGPKRILVDTEHGNEFSKAELEPLVDALFAAGHTVVYADETTDSVEYGEDLGRFDALLVVQPTDPFEDTERRAVRNFTDRGGRLVVLAEPTQVDPGGTFSLPRPVRFGANNLTGGYGLHVAAEQLYNVDDTANDNNFKAIYTTPRRDDPLTEGVETVTLDTAGYLVLAPGSGARSLYTAVDGTRTLETRRTGTYPTVARSGNVTVVADSSFVRSSEVYDADNERFVSNLLEFLVGGDAPGALTPTATPTPTPAPTATPTPAGNASAVTAPAPG